MAENRQYDHEYKVQAVKLAKETLPKVPLPLTAPERRSFLGKRLPSALENCLKMVGSQLMWNW